MQPRGSGCDPAFRAVDERAHIADTYVGTPPAASAVWTAPALSAAAGTTDAAGRVQTADRAGPVPTKENHPELKVTKYDPDYDVVGGLPKIVKNALCPAGYLQGFGNDPQAARENYELRNRGLLRDDYAMFGQPNCQVFQRFDKHDRPYYVAMADFRPAHERMALEEDVDAVGAADGPSPYGTMLGTETPQSVEEGLAPYGEACTAASSTPTENTACPVPAARTEHGLMSGRAAPRPAKRMFPIEESLPARAGDGDEGPQPSALGGARTLEPWPLNLEPPHRDYSYLHILDPP